MIPYLNILNAVCTWCLGVDGLALVGGHGAALVDRVPDHVDDAAEGLGPHGNHDGGAGVVDNLPTHQTLGTVHSNRPEKSMGFPKHIESNREIKAILSEAAEFSKCRVIDKRYLYKRSKSHL